VPVLIKIDYNIKIREIIIRVNINLKGYKGYLGQKDIKSRKVHSIYYKSSI
jgi:hypothetical protein